MIVNRCVAKVETGLNMMCRLPDEVSDIIIGVLIIIIYEEMK